MTHTVKLNCIIGQLHVFPLSRTLDVKGGKPSACEVDELAGRIGQKWNKLGICLDISNDVQEEITANADDKP